MYVVSESIMLCNNSDNVTMNEGCRYNGDKK